MLAFLFGFWPQSYTLKRLPPYVAKTTIRLWNELHAAKLISHDFSNLLAPTVPGFYVGILRHDEIKAIANCIAQNHDHQNANANANTNTNANKNQSSQNSADIESEEDHGAQPCGEGSQLDLRSILATQNDSIYVRTVAHPPEEYDAVSKMLEQLHASHNTFVDWGAIRTQPRWYIEQLLMTANENATS